MKVTGCIPSRYASTRLPGKPLCDIGGKPMVIRVVEQALQAKSLNEVIVLTDDERIRDAVKNAGYRAVMTSEQCASGTDRIAEYMKIDPSTDIFVNMQGDEVLLDPKHIDVLVGNFIGRDDAEMGTLAHWESRAEVLGDPTTAKVVMGRDNQALYFSRNCIPVRQDGNLPEQALVQIGVYIYTRNALEKLGRLEQAPLESTEKLEQLRALEHGIKITVSIVDHYESLSVDTEQDLAKAQKIFGKC
ncbi:8-amino-3,8-dideoxy-manno-octulosonate cytidylyltransferase [bacterium MnTg03]|nr:8-amino-3,8-dideoxy-manno-octulosonate cytidylyltransferase [bacterium MnTg03]